jgi:hypothetical protein
VFEKGGDVVRGGSSGAGDPVVRLSMARPPFFGLEKERAALAAVKIGVKKNSTNNERGLSCFLNRFGNDVIGVLSGFDRLRFQGTLRALYQPDGMATFLARVGVRWKDFADYVQMTTRRLRTAAEAWASEAGRPCVYLRRTTESKEELARAIAQRDGVRQGKVALLSAVEPCRTWMARGNRANHALELKLLSGKCIHLYFYVLHEELGLMHLRLQTWFPFLAQVCINGRQWLARQMIKAGLKFTQKDNCFTAVEDMPKAQALLDEQLHTDWSGLLNGLIDQCHPLHRALMTPLGLSYYWTAAQSEFATDLLFSDPAQLGQLYPRLIRYGITHFGSEDVLRFLGRGRARLDAFGGEVTSSYKQRPEGVRLKHRRDGNSLKMYDKEGQILRIETTLTEPKTFKVYRPKENDPEGKQEWLKLRRAVADLHRRAEVSRAANERYLEALSAAPTDATLGELLQPLSQRRRPKNRPHRGLSLFSQDDLRLLEAVNRGEHAINGFRNKDLRVHLFAAGCSKTARQQSAAVTRKLALLRAHGLIQKIPHTHRYRLTLNGHRSINALFTARDLQISDLEKLAA